MSFRSVAWRNAMRHGNNPPFFADLLVWVDANDLDGSQNATLTNGGDITSIVNKGSMGGSFDRSATTSGAKFRSTLGPGGGPCVDGGIYISTLAASSWRFLHRGDAFTSFNEWVRGSSGNNRSVWATCGNTSTGAFVRALTSTRMNFGRGTINTLLSGTGQFSDTQWNRYTLKVNTTSPRDSLNVNNASPIISDAATGGPMADVDPQIPLRFGGFTATGANESVAYLATQMIYGRALDAGEIAQVKAWRDATTGSFPQ